MTLRSRLKHGTNRFREAVLGNGEPAVQTDSNTDQYAHFTLRGDIDSISPNHGDLEHYREQYEVCPLVRVAINTFAEDVTAPGHRVATDNDELQTELEEWLSNCAIVGGESHRDFSEILYSTVVQEQVRGTAMTEVVRKEESDDEIWGFRMVNPSTIEAFTYENKPILIRPDDTDVDGVTTTPRGEAAAYGQYGEGALAAPFNRETNYLSQNDIIKLVKDPDTAEIFGNSTIGLVSNEIDEMYQILNDLGEAIHSKGYPLWVFGLGEAQGDAQNPRAGIWPEEKIKDYRDDHKEGNWSANQKDFVPGDVDVQRIEGEVPEIEEILDWYVEEIVSAMPIPKYKLGFANNINRDITSEQSPQYERQIKAKRHRLQKIFTPILQKKARELGYDDEAATAVRLKIEETRNQNPLERDDFAADDFATFAQGLQAATAGSPQDVVSPDELRSMLGLGERGVDDNNSITSLADGEGSDGHDHEYDAEVQAQFEEMYGEPLTPDAVGDDEIVLDTSPDDSVDDNGA